jgi:hypothetical protein
MSPPDEADGRPRSLINPEGSRFDGELQAVEGILAALPNSERTSYRNINATAISVHGAELLADEPATELTTPFFMIKKLRKQYPIHEEFEVSGSGVRARRTELEQAESFFGLRHDAPSDWHAVRTKFVTALESLLDALENHE